MNALHTPPQAPLRLVASCAPAAPAPAASPVARPQRLPLFRRPGRVAVLAEDPALVDALARSLPRRWRVRPFLCATSCLYALQQEPPLWQADLWQQQQLIESWRAGAPLVPLVLRYWAQAPQRRELTAVAVVDALMSGFGGLDMLSELIGWSGRRVLMAGAFDAVLGRDAFADGRIDRFVLKRDHSLRADLVRSVDGLLGRADSVHEDLWATTLRSDQVELLRRPGVTEDLEDSLQSHWVEWIVLGEPFGVLGLDAAGTAHWLQLADPAGLQGLADRAMDVGLPAAAAHDIRRGRRLANVDLRTSLGLPGADLLPACQLGGPGGLLAAATRIRIVPSPVGRSRGALATSAGAPTRAFRSLPVLTP